MIVDASALLAIMLYEEEADLFMDAIADMADPWMSAVNYVEAGIRLDRLSPGRPEMRLDAFLRTSGITVQSISAAQARLAREAHLAYGKGRHPAKLNLGDCLAYALARESGRPLLYKGGDFALTDIEAGAAAPMRLTAPAAARSSGRRSRARPRACRGGERGLSSGRP